MGKIKTVLGILASTAILSNNQSVADTISIRARSVEGSCRYSTNSTIIWGAPVSGTIPAPLETTNIWGIPVSINTTASLEITCDSKDIILSESANMARGFLNGAFNFKISAPGSTNTRTSNTSLPKMLSILTTNNLAIIKNYFGDDVSLNITFPENTSAASLLDKNLKSILGASSLTMEYILSKSPYIDLIFDMVPSSYSCSPVSTNSDGAARSWPAIEKTTNSITLTWPTDTTNLTHQLMGAPTLEGPWEPVVDPYSLTNALPPLKISTTNSIGLFKLGPKEITPSTSPAF